MVLLVCAHSPVGVQFVDPNSTAFALFFLTKTTNLLWPIWLFGSSRLWSSAAVFARRARASWLPSIFFGVVLTSDFFGTTSSCIAFDSTT